LKHFTSLSLRAVPSAGLEARLNGRPGGPPLQVLPCRFRNPAYFTSEMIELTLVAMNNWRH
jgi:hypothetical protein